jgi:hypothetical protein
VGTESGAISSSSKPSYWSVRQRITELKRLDLSSVEIDFIKSRLELLMAEYAFGTPFVPQGQELFRGIRYSEKPISSNQLTYPCAELVQRDQRANRAFSPMFYCSIAREPVFFELRVAAGDYIALSRWRVDQKFLVNNVGYASAVFAKLRSVRNTPDWGGEHPKIGTLKNRQVAAFFSSEFTREVAHGNEHLYKLSVAIAERLCSGSINGSSEDQKLGLDRFAGVMYPPVAMRANADNLALFPEFVDRCLRLEAVEWIRVDEQRQDFKYNITKLDFAGTFGSSGEIEWKGRLPQWKLERRGEQLIFAVENGQWVARDEGGNVVKPS